MLPNSNDIPNISPILAILDPVILPRTKPGESLLSAATDVKSSGVEVAIDAMVNPTTTGGTPS